MVFSTWYKNVASIVIDGQNRLLSLKRYWNAHTGKEPLDYIVKGF